MLEVDSIQAAGREYTRLRRQRGLPPLKGKLRAICGVHGPVIIRCKGILYTLMRGTDPCPAA